MLSRMKPNWEQTIYSKLQSGTEMVKQDSKQHPASGRRSCIHIGETKKKRAGDLDQRTQGYNQTGRSRNIGNCRTRLGIPSSDTMKRNQCTRSSHQNPLLITETLHICLSHSQLLHRNEGVAIPECGQLVLTHAVMTNSIHPTLRQGSYMLCRMHDLSL